MPESIDALVNPLMLSWSRGKTGLDLTGAARKIGTSAQRLQEWENGDRFPTILQAIKMAEVYKRPLSAFYLKDVPTDYSIPSTDFRRLPDGEIQPASPRLIWEHRQAEIRRDLMIELAEEEGAGYFPYQNRISLANKTEEAAQIARGLLGISWEQQSKWQDPGEAWKGWRNAIEAQNVLVFQTNPSGKSVDILEARGFSINSDRYPVIEVNSLDSQRGRIFTLLHEYTHLLLNEGGLCDCWEYQTITTAEVRAEVFCNHVAAAILIPASIIQASEIVRKHDGGLVWTDEEIEALSVEFSVSKESIVRRLLTLSLTDEPFYQQKRQEYYEKLKAFKKHKEEEEDKAGGPPYHRLVLSRIGKPFARQVLAAYHNKQITLADASEYIDAKVKFVRRIEAEVASTGA